MNKKKVVYCASGWFSADQAEQLTRLEKVLDDRAHWIDLRAPRRIFVCKPDASQEIQETVFKGNIQHIAESDFVVANTSYRDLGVLFECGVSYEKQKPIVYFCEGLPKSAKFNLMLSKSAVKVTTSIEELVDYLDRVEANNGEILVEPYLDSIE